MKIGLFSDIPRSNLVSIVYAIPGHPMLSGAMSNLLLSIQHSRPMLANLGIAMDYVQLSHSGVKVNYMHVKDSEWVQIYHQARACVANVILYDISSTDQLYNSNDLGVDASKQSVVVVMETGYADTANIDHKSRIHTLIEQTKAQSIVFVSAKLTNARLLNDGWRHIIDSQDLPENTAVSLGFDGLTKTLTDIARAQAPPQTDTWKCAIL